MITENSKVTLHFSIELEDGNLIESTFGTSPASFSMGDGSLLPGFEKCLLGLKINDKERFQIPQEDGFGAHNPQNIQTFGRDVFDKDMELTEGLIVSFADASGAELPGVVKTIADDKVEVDFNHPLAGRALTFTVEIVDVE